VRFNVWIHPLPHFPAKLRRYMKLGSLPNRIHLLKINGWVPCPKMEVDASDHFPNNG